jgi:hypothetical protein
MPDGVGWDEWDEKENVVGRLPWLVVFIGLVEWTGLKVDKSKGGRVHL